jgi:chromosome segregation ATPase
MIEADLNFLARQNERLITDVGSLRDDMRVLTAIVMRLDNTPERHESLLADMLREIQAMNARAARTDDRLRRLEEAGR